MTEDFFVNFPFVLLVFIKCSKLYDVVNVSLFLFTTILDGTNGGITKIVCKHDVKGTEGDRGKPIMGWRNKVREYMR